MCSIIPFIPTSVFDKVDDVLLTKLLTYVSHNDLLIWIESYLVGRTQQEKLENIGLKVTSNLY